MSVALAMTEPAAPPPGDAADERRGKRRDSERRCIVTGAVGAPDGLVRFVVGPARDADARDGAGAVYPDVDERLPGRGLWVTAARDVLARAVAKGAFARAAGGRVAVDPALVDHVETLLATRVIASLGLARRAGAAVAGYEKVRSALAAGRTVLLLEARDAGADARKRLAGLSGRCSVLRVLDAAELAAAFGRDVAVHVAILGGAGAGGRLAAEIERDCRRLSGFRPDAAGAMIDRTMDGR